MSRAILVIGFLAACTSPGAVTTRTVTDSAGVMNVTLPAEDPAVPERALDLEHPVFALGGTSDTSGTFSYIRSPMPLANGALLVSTDDAWHLHVIDSNGQDIGRFGRDGEGPGEFIGSPALRRWGDSVFALVDRRGTVTVTSYDTAMTFGGVRTVRNNGVYDSNNGILTVDGTGRLLIWQAIARGDQPGPYRSKEWIRRLAQDSTQDSTILSWSGEERYQLGGSATAMIKSTYVVFGKQSFATSSGSMIYLGTNDGFTINGYDMDGRLARSIRIAAPEVLITAADRERYEREVREDEVPETRHFTAALIENLKYAKVLRWHDAFYPTADGGLWIERARLSERDPRHLLILDSTATLIDRFTLPADAEPLWIGRDRALLRWRDADSVRNFVMVPIRPPTRAASAVTDR